MEPRLGIAFSGGGFRAAFFHLGVLRRLAELDLLRHVTTFSTVSGGSMLAALYFLHFKKQFERHNGELTREQFIAIVDDVEQDFIRGNRADLRNRLFMSTARHFLALLARRSYGEEMARLYAKHLYGSVTQDLAETRTPQGIRLHDAIVEVPSPGDTIPQRARDESSKRERFRSSGYPGRRDKGKLLSEINDDSRPNIPRMIFNATCLNTGGRFAFMLNEVGGPMTGYVRVDEVLMLMQYKRLMYKLGSTCFGNGRFNTVARDVEEWGRELQKKYPDLPDTAFHPEAGKGFPAYGADHLRFYLAAKARRNLGAPPGNARKWLPPVFHTWKPEPAPLQRLVHTGAWPVVEALLTCSFGKLRRAKIAAWYLLDTPDFKTEIRAGYGSDLFVALTAIDAQLPAALAGTTPLSSNTAAFILDFYYMRSAEVIDRDAASAFEHLTLPVAVAASANFPPIFTPFKIDDLFDRDTTDTIALTDGGVHDNQGIDGLVEDGCEYIIATDAGGLLARDPDPADSRLPMMDRIIEILMGSLREVQIDHVSSPPRVRRALQKWVAKGFNAWQELGHAHRVQEFVSFHVTSRFDRRLTPLPARYDPEVVASVRTDLDAFNDVEIAVLKYEGYRTSDAFVRPALVDDPTSPFHDSVPEPAVFPGDLPSPARARRVLSAGARRVGRFSDAHPLLAAIFAIVTAVAFTRLGVDTCNNIRERWKNDHVWHNAINTLDSVDVRVAFGLTNSTIAKRLTTNRSLPIVEKLETLPKTQKAVSDIVGKQSIIAWACALWALFVLLRTWYRRSHVSWPDWEWLRHLYGVRVRAVAICAAIARPITLVSLAFAIIFAASLHGKWLLGIIPLWSLPLALLFALCHHVFRRLWMLAGWMPERPFVRRMVLKVFG